MVPARCVFEVGIRLPVGMNKERVLTEVEKIVSCYPEVSYKEIIYNPPSSCAPNGDMVHFLQTNAIQVSGIKPEPTISLGGTDCRLWRYRNYRLTFTGHFLTTWVQLTNMLRWKNFSRL